MRIALLLVGLLLCGLVLCVFMGVVETVSLVGGLFILALLRLWADRARS